MKKPLTLLINHNDEINIRRFPQQAEEILQLYPSLALGYLASYLKANGYPVELIDANALKMSHGGLEKAASATGADVVGITATTIGWHGVVAAAKVVRKALPNALIVVGGPQMSELPLQSMQHDCFDLGVAGDGEETLLEIVQRVEKGDPASGIAGTVERIDGRAVQNSPRPWIRDLSALPHPAVELMPMERYNCLTLEKPFFTMVSSRGCPYRCGFCSQASCGSIIRYRRPEDVAGEMEKYVRHHGAREIVMFDETFTLDEKRVIEICRLIIERKLHFRWNVRTRVDSITAPMLKALKQAGCYGLHMGVESGSQRILDLMNKGITLDQVRNAFRLARQYGFQTRGYFMIGYMDEDRKTYDDSVRLATQLGMDWASFAITTPVPGTDVFARSAERGLIDPDFWEKYTALQIPADAIPMVKSDHWDEEELRKMMARAYFRFYARPFFLVRRLSLVRSWKQFTDLFKGLRIMSMIGK